MLFIKKLFDFSKPRFLNLDHIDIVVEEKMLFLISWKSKRYQKVKILPLNKTYHDSETAVVLKLPDNIVQLTITLHSFWRKRKYRVLLKKVKLDEVTAHHLIKRFKPIVMLGIKKPAVNSVHILQDTNLPNIVLQKPSIKINATYLSINRDKLTHTNKTNHYE